MSIAQMQNFYYNILAKEANKMFDMKGNNIFRTLQDMSRPY